MRSVSAGGLAAKVERAGLSVGVFDLLKMFVTREGSSGFSCKLRAIQELPPGTKQSLVVAYLNSNYSLSVSAQLHLPR